MTIDDIINSGEKITLKHLHNFYDGLLHAEVLNSFLEYNTAYLIAEEQFDRFKGGTDLLSEPTFDFVGLGGKMFTKGSTGSTVGSFIALLTKRPFSATRYMVLGFVLGNAYEALRGVGIYLWEKRKYNRPEQKTAREECKKHEELIDNVKKTYFAALNQKFAQRLFGEKQF